MRFTKTVLLSTLFSLSISSSVIASASAPQWKPVSAEALIELPVNLIEKRIEQDFVMSPAAQSLQNLEQDIAAKSQKIKALQSLLSEASDTEMLDEQVALVKEKSAFLDDMEEGQALRQSMLSQKIEVYQSVLEKLYQQSGRQAETVEFQIQKQQNSARERMQKVMAQVDSSMSQAGYVEQSPYADEFASNLAKLDKLRDAIAEHQANQAPQIDGMAVSTDEYVRQLLMQAASEQSLLDQEGLMLSYMSRLVALDAQALEFTINSQANDDALEQISLTTSPAKAVDLFL